MQQKKFRIRTNYIINPAFQFRFILYFIIIGFISLAIFYCANLYFFKTLINQGVQLQLPKTHVYFELISTQRILMNKIFLITAGFFFALISILGLLLSHRIAGPIYKMTLMLNKFQGLSDLSEIHFRKKDFFMELSSAFNNFVAKVKK